MKVPGRAAACLVHLAGGFVLWSSCFVVLYALLSLGCEAGGGAWLRPALVAAWGLHLGLLALLLALQWAWRPRRSGDAPAARFAPPPALHRVALSATVVALIATVWIGWPVLAVPACEGSELRTAAPA